MKYENIPQEIKNLNQWVCVWKNSKIPMRADQRKGASSVNAETWSDFETAKTAVEQGLYDNIGFVFNDNGIVGIDIDVGYNDDGFLSDLSIDIMKACQSYTERSRSGRGIHILLKGDLPFKGKNNGSGVEIYKSCRYFITTGDKLIYDKVIENQEAIDYVVEKYFAECLKESSESTNGRIYQPTYCEPTNGKISIRPTYPKIGEGMRNISLTSLAGQMHNQGYTPEQIYTELQHANKVACKPPLCDSELQTIVSSVTRYQR